MFQKIENLVQLNQAVTQVRPLFSVLEGQQNDVEFLLEFFVLLEFTSR